MPEKKKVAGIAAAILIVLACCLYPFRYYITGTSSAPVKAKENKDFNIEDIHSRVDKDKDGIDDQTDILQGARNYIAKRPSYKSVYYDGGYPDDNYGVCSDVVAQALLNAGYDLQKLVHDDILAHPQDYDVEKPDDNIDFRRVRNLRVYLSHKAISLTTDVHEISQWQGGDIVVFEKHIGIVSDKRNNSGVAYVIHHNDPGQRSYEEDILERRRDIVGHYRISE